ncbi:MAG: hypothetical protein ABI488_11905 [Polyangiaceae bacterium]
MNRRCMRLCSFGVSVLLASVCARAHAEDRGRIGQDELVLPARHLRLTAGTATVYQSESAYQAIGFGLNLEEAVGLGQNLELGVRFAARPDRTGQGTRADEFARGFELNSFGTGLSVTANPELRLAWRALRWPEVPLVELGIEGRVVLPIEPDPNTTVVLGMVTRLHLHRALRVDASFWLAVTSEKFYEERLATVAGAAPLAVWFDPGRVGYLGLIQNLRHDFATRYTTGVTRWQLGAGIGSRFGVFDLLFAMFLPDTLGDGTHRVAAGLTLTSTW